MESLFGVLGFLLLASGLPLQDAKRESRPLRAFALAGTSDGSGALVCLGVCRKRGLFRMRGLCYLLGAHKAKATRPLEAVSTLTRL